jgi:hypothetical protein
MDLLQITVICTTFVLMNVMALPRGISRRYFIWCLAISFLVAFALAALFGGSQLDMNKDMQYCDSLIAIEDANFTLHGEACRLKPELFLQTAVVFGLLLGVLQSPAYLYFLYRFGRRFFVRSRV